MPFFYFVLAFVTLLAVGGGAWLIWKEETSGAASFQEKPPRAATEQKKSAAPSPASPHATLTALAQKMGLSAQEPPAGTDPAAKKQRPGLQSLIMGLLKKPAPEATPLTFPQAAGTGKPADAGTAGLRLDDVFAQKPAERHEPAEFPETTSQIEQRCQDLQKQIEEMQQKYQQLEILFQEKSRGLQEMEDSLASETQNRKEFNKVKDLLEKELRDSKDKCRDLEISLAHAQTESKSHLARIGQLEEKIKKLEPELAAQEDAVRAARADEDNEKKQVTTLAENLDKIQTVIKSKDEKIRDLVDHFKDQQIPQKTAGQEKPSGQPGSIAPSGQDDPLPEQIGPALSEVREDIPESLPDPKAKPDMPGLKEQIHPEEAQEAEVIDKDKKEAPGPDIQAALKDVPPETTAETPPFSKFTIKENDTEPQGEDAEEDGGEGGDAPLPLAPDILSQHPPLDNTADNRTDAVPDDQDPEKSDKKEKE